MRSKAACAAVLIVQLGTIAYSRLGSARYFCWAPFDTQTRYALTVVLPGLGVLPEEAVRRRYRIKALGTDNRSPQHVIDIVRQYEETYGKPDGAEVALRYSVNGRPFQEWRWPRP
ncbi:MAG: hypothetical protein HY059_09610 [Proteobacteria bacterium]|nr:hypothetical protein [Pseudomonadota bacterium]